MFEGHKKFKLVKQATNGELTLFNKPTLLNCTIIPFTIESF